MMGAPGQSKQSASARSPIGRAPAAPVTVAASAPAPPRMSPPTIPFAQADDDDMSDGDADNGDDDDGRISETQSVDGGGYVAAASDLPAGQQLAAMRAHAREHPPPHDGGPDDLVGDAVDDGDVDLAEPGAGGYSTDEVADDDPSRPPHLSPQPLTSQRQQQRLAHTRKPSPLPLMDEDETVLSDTERSDSPSAAAPVSPSAASAAASSVAAVEPDDPSIPSWDVSIPLSLLNAHMLLNTLLPLEPFDLLGYRWHLDLYPLRDDGDGRCVGAFLKLMGKTGGGLMSWVERPSVYFRIVVAHREVIAEAREAAGANVDGATVAASPSPPPPPPPPPPPRRPSNDRRNLERSVFSFAKSFNQNEDYGYKNFLPHKRLAHFVDAHTKAIHMRVLMQSDRATAGSGARMRTLASFLTHLPPGAPTPRWPYLGLTNQGATCYMNSYLQTLFYLPTFRQAVYNIPVDPQQMLELIDPAVSAEGLVLARSPSPVGSQSSRIPVALQHLFYQLQTEHSAMGTKTLTKSFGWDSAEAFQQHDVQEFSRVLLDTLDLTVAKCTPPLPPITRLFEGQQEMFIECTRVPYTSTRVETFLDLSLNVKGMATLRRAFDDYAAVETMDGKNLYRAVDDSKGINYGMQEARKGIRFLRFPHVLQLQLKRFEYTETGHMRKLDEKLEYPAVLDLTDLEYGADEPETSPDSESPPAAAAAKPAASKKSRARLPTDPNDPAIYHLHSVLVHRGSMGGGHYYAFIRPFLQSSAAPGADAVAAYAHAPWLKFDDEQVSICADSTEALDRNFGGEYTDTVSVLGQIRQFTKNTGASAYMLVYVRQKMVQESGMGAINTEEGVPPMEAAGMSNDVHPVSSAAAAMGPPPSLHLQATAAPLDHSHAPSDERKENGMDVDDDGSMLQPRASASPPVVPRPASLSFTADPPNVYEFINALQPVSVPLPSHINGGLEEARRVRAEREAAARQKALELPVEVLLERDLVWQGLRDPKGAESEPLGSGGVAGLGLTVAPAVDTARPAPFPLHSFLYRTPVRSHTFLRTDTLAFMRAALAKEVGLPPERLQFWRVHRKHATVVTGAQLGRQQMDVLSDERKTLAELLVAGLPHVNAGMPLLLVRDCASVDLHPQLQSLSSSAGHVADNSYRSLDPVTDPGSGTSHRQLLLFKLFDVLSQRMVYLGSAVLWRHMGVGELKRFVLALMATRGISAEVHATPPHTHLQSFDQLQVASVKQEADHPPPASLPSASSVGPTLPFLPLMHAVGERAVGLRSMGAFVPPAPSDDVEVTGCKMAPGANAPADAPTPQAPERSFDEAHWEHRRQQRTEAEAKADAAAVEARSAAFSLILQLQDESECASEAMRISVKCGTAGAGGPPPATNTLLQVGRGGKDASNAAALQSDASTLRECGLVNGCVLLVSFSATPTQVEGARQQHAAARAREHARGDGKQGKRKRDSGQSSSASPAKPTAKSRKKPMLTADASAATPMEEVEQVTTGSGASAAPSSSAAPAAPSLSLLPLASLAPLPSAPHFHSHTQSFVSYLLHRFVVDFRPALLDVASMEHRPLDPAQWPLHPLSQLQPPSLVLEVSTADSLAIMLAQLAAAVSRELAPALPSYPQLADSTCYKLWKQSPLHPGTLSVKNSDVTQRPLSGGPRTVAFSLVAQQNADGLGPLEQLTRNPAARSTVHTLFFEISAVPLPKLEEQWWFRVQFVDARGGVHRLPSEWPGLCAEQPLLLPKAPDCTLGTLQQRVYDALVAHRAHLPLGPCMLEGADGQLLSAAHVAEDGGEGAPAASSSSSSKKRPADEEVPHVAKKLKSEDARGVDVVEHANVATDAPSTSLPTLRATAVEMAVYVPDAAPLVPPTRASFLAPAPPTPALMDHFLVPWTNYPHALSPVAHYQQVRFFERARGPKGGVSRFPDLWSDHATHIRHYRQPLPFVMTVWMQPLPSPLTLAWLYRFTTFRPLAAKQSYSFSPLPPLAVGMDPHDTLASFRARLAKQMGQPEEELQLALLKPKHYELMRDEADAQSASASTSAAAAAAASPAPPVPVPGGLSSLSECASAVPAPSVAAHLFSEWVADERGDRGDVQLGLLDGSSPHTLSSSLAQMERSSLVTKNNVVGFNKKKTAAISMAIG